MISRPLILPNTTIPAYKGPTAPFTVLPKGTVFIEVMFLPPKLSRLPSNCGCSAALFFSWSDFLRSYRHSELSTLDPQTLPSTDVVDHVDMRGCLRLSYPKASVEGKVEGGEYEQVIALVANCVRPSLSIEVIEKKYGPPSVIPPEIFTGDCYLHDKEKVYGNVKYLDFGFVYCTSIRLSGSSGAHFVQREFLLLNKTSAPADWIITHVPVTQKVKVLAPREKRDMSEQEEVGAIDDPTVFKFLPGTKGRLHGPSVPSRALPLGPCLPVALPHFDSDAYKPLLITVQFDPFQNILYRSRYVWNSSGADALWTSIISLRHRADGLWTLIISLRHRADGLWTLIISLRHRADGLWTSIISLRHRADVSWTSIISLRHRADGLWTSIISLRHRADGLWTSIRLQSFYTS